MPRLVPVARTGSARARLSEGLLRKAGRDPASHRPHSAAPLATGSRAFSASEPTPEAIGGSPPAAAAARFKATGQAAKTGDDAVDGEVNLLCACLNRVVREDTLRGFDPASRVNVRAKLDIAVGLKAVNRMSRAALGVVAERDMHRDEVDRLREEQKRTNAVVLALKRELRAAKLDLAALSDPATVRRKMADIKHSDQTTRQEHLRKQCAASLSTHAALRSQLEERKLLLTIREQQGERLHNIVRSVDEMFKDQPANATWAASELLQLKTLLPPEPVVAAAVAGALGCVIVDVKAVFAARERSLVKPQLAPLQPGTIGAESVLVLSERLQKSVFVPPRGSKADAATDSTGPPPSYYARAPAQAALPEPVVHQPPVESISIHTGGVVANPGGDALSPPTSQALKHKRVSTQRRRATERAEQLQAIHGPGQLASFLLGSACFHKQAGLSDGSEAPEVLITVGHKSAAAQLVDRGCKPARGGSKGGSFETTIAIPQAEPVGADDLGLSVLARADGRRVVSRIDECRTFYGAVVRAFQHGANRFDLVVDKDSFRSRNTSSLDKQSASYGLEELHSHLMGLRAPCLLVLDLPHPDATNGGEPPGDPSPPTTTTTTTAAETTDIEPPAGRRPSTAQAVAAESCAGPPRTPAAASESPPGACCRRCGLPSDREPGPDTCGGFDGAAARATWPVKNSLRRTPAWLRRGDPCTGIPAVGDDPFVPPADVYAAAPGEGRGCWDSALCQWCAEDGGEAVDKGAALVTGAFNEKTIGWKVAPDRLAAALGFEKKKRTRRAPSQAAGPRRLEQPMGVVHFVSRASTGTGVPGNAHLSKAIACVVSSSVGAASRVSAIVDRFAPDDGGVVPYFCTQDRPGQWVMLDFGAVFVIPQAYSFASTSPIAVGTFPLSWRFEGSMDRLHWDLLRRHVGDKTFSKNNLCGYWPLPCLEEARKLPLGHYYRYFRVLLEGPNTVGTHQLQLSCFEVYGRALMAREYTPIRQCPQSMAAPRPCFAGDPLSMPDDTPFRPFVKSKKKKK
ncbi:hypothetical protein DIPPA_00926 [Diplonema papillatum]|nr:hypothetical protein DIPPA_00926 [Diplonema papillatum]